MLDKKVNIKVSKKMIIPAASGVYRFFTGKDIIYIGSAINLKSRVNFTHQKLLRIIKDKVPNVMVSYILTEYYFSMERFLINKHKPFYNKIKPVFIKTNYPKVAKKIHMEADRKLRKLSNRYISKDTIIKLAKKHDVSGQTVINYIYGLGKDGFLKQCLIEDLKTV